MTLPGGPADKLGNLYEKWWTLSQFVRMLQGDAESIRIEDPGVDKAEFVVTTGSHRELHQCKRSHPKGKWSLAALRAGGFLEAVGRHLAHNQDRFVFASASDARELADLCEAAISAQSAEEFKAVFVKARERNANLTKLLEDWKCDEHTAIDYLRRIEVRTIGDRELEEKVRWAILALFLANANDVADELRAIADDSVHRTVTHQELVDKLSRRGYQLRRVNSPASAGTAIQAATTTQYLDGARRKLIRQQLVPRHATQTLLSRLSDTATESVMTGGAGSGKTACVVEIVDALRKRNVPVLAFRLDRFVSASTTAALGQRLDLEESPVLVLAAAAEATRGSSVLIIDQLDAVSTMSGRASAAFDLVEQLLLEARGSRARAAIHVVVVCREFDWENDPRMRRLLPESHAQVDIVEFSNEAVKKILTDAGFETRAFSERQLRILRLPQNLSFFLDADFDSSRTPAFDTATEILRRYWDAKRRFVADRVAPAPDQWMAVMDTLCEEMTATQQLSVREEKLDAFAPDYLDQLASEGVISFDGRRYGFGHETFFDYVFARLFSARSESLVAWLKASEQQLFRRAQVRQALAYLRDTDDARYVNELRDLLSDDGVRTHLKDLVFALLAEVTNPTDAEWTIWKKWLGPAITAIERGAPCDDKLSMLAWRRFFASRSWFAEIDRRGLIERRLESDNGRCADMAVNYLRFHQRHSPDRVASLLEPYVDGGGEWRLRLRFLMEAAEYHTSRRFFDLFLRLVKDGTLDEARDRFVTNGTFWSMLYNLGEHRPEWVSEVFAQWFLRRLTLIRKAGKELSAGALLDHDQPVSRLVVIAARNAPAAFVEHVLPTVLKISDAAVTGALAPPRRDAVWRILFNAEYLNGVGACLSKLAGALAVLANTSVRPLSDVIIDLRRRDTYTANYLLLSLYRGGASRYADDVAALLRDEPWRFECGYSDSPHWCAMETIRAVVPHCTAESRERIEAAILSYVSPYERTSRGRQQFGRTRFNLLSAFPEEFRSKNANAHFDELARKFGEPTQEPRAIIDSAVTSPIETIATKKMTDEQWLRAIAKYASENIYYSGNERTGGARELARELEERVKEAPTRFARLALRFPVNTNSVYLERTLDALKDAPIASDLKLALCRKAFADARGYCGRTIADVLGRMEDALPDDGAGMLDWFATQDADPAVELWKEDAGSGQSYYGGDLYFHGINTTRGQAAEAIGNLIFGNATYIGRFRTTLDRMVRDLSPAVLSCVARTLRAVAHHDPSLGMTLFQDMALSEDRLLATPHVYEFIRSGLNNHLSEMRPVIERMVRSAEPDVCQGGARLAGIAALQHEVATDLADEALRGGARQRRGMAQVASANLAAQECRIRCEAWIVRLFADADSDVRREAASCFHSLPDEVLGKYEELIAAFCDSAAFEEDPSFLLHALEESRERLPGTTCTVCGEYLSRLANAAQDSRPGLFGDARTVAKLIFRTYQQHQNDEWTQPALDLIDFLCLEGVPDAGSELEQFER